MILKQSIKKLTTAALSATLVFVLAACGGEGAANEPGTAEASEQQKEEVSEQKEEASKEQTEKAEERSEDSAEGTEDAAGADEEKEEEGAEAHADEPVYITVYRELVKEMSDSGTADQFILAKINDDDVWELLASNSEGPFDQENTFIYTVYNDKPVLLASVIAGVDGASLSYSEKNLIRQTGSMAGMADVYSSIEDGALKEEFRAEMANTNETDASGDEVFRYTVNGKEVDQKEYEKQLADFNAKYAPFVVIDAEGLNVMEFADGEFAEGTQLAYWTAEDTLGELDSMAKE